MSSAIPLQSMTAAECGDQLLEAARKALIKYAQHELIHDFQDGGYERGADVMRLALRVRALRRPAVVARMDAERLARVMVRNA